MFINIHRITRKKRNILAFRITHGLNGKRPVRSRRLKPHVIKVTQISQMTQI